MSKTPVKVPKLVNNFVAISLCPNPTSPIPQSHKVTSYFHDGAPPTPLLCPATVTPSTYPGSTDAITSLPAGPANDDSCRKSTFQTTFPCVKV